MPEVCICHTYYKQHTSSRAIGITFVPNACVLDAFDARLTMLERVTLNSLRSASKQGGMGGRKLSGRTRAKSVYNWFFVINLNKLINITLAARKCSTTRAHTASGHGCLLPCCCIATTAHAMRTTRYALYDAAVLITYARA